MPTKIAEKIILFLLRASGGLIEGNKNAYGMKYWIKRVATYPAHLRHRLGFGVQSPWAFYLVRFVLREKWPFYAFDELKTLRRQLPKNASTFSQKHDERLFRLANWLKPDRVFVVGETCPALSAIYLGAYTKHVEVTCLCEHITTAEEGALGSRGVNCLCGDVMTLLQSQCPANGFGCLLIALKDKAWQLYDYAANHTNDNSMFVVEYLDTQQGKMLWKRILDDSRAKVTFNLGRTGLVFFDHKRTKMNYDL